jgi:hypothetical protein
VLLVDTNVLIDVLQDDPRWADWSIGQLRAQSQAHALAINPVIYAQLSLSFTSLEALDKAIDGHGLQLVELSRPALFLACKAFLRSANGRWSAGTGRNPDGFEEAFLVDLQPPASSGGGSSDGATLMGLVALGLWRWRHRKSAPGTA